MPYSPDNAPLLAQTQIKILDDKGSFYWERYVNGHCVEDAGQRFVTAEQAEEDAIIMLTDNVVETVGIEYYEWEQASLEEKLNFIKQIFS